MNASSASSSTGSEAYARKVFVVLLLITLPLAWVHLKMIMAGFKVSDFHIHLGLLQQTLQGAEPWPAHPGFYFLTALFARFSPDRDGLVVAGLIVLMLALLAKMTLLFWQGRTLGGSSASPVWLAIVTLVVMFGFCLPNPWLHPWTRFFYTGNITPNAWHNPTAMLLFPLAVLQFVAAYQWLEGKALKPLVMCVMWGLLALLAKPSYMLAFLPAFALITVLKLHATPRLMLHGLLAAGLLAAGVLAQKSIVYSDGSPSEVAFGFMKVWRAYHSVTSAPGLSITLSLVLSMALPLAAVCWRPALLRDTLWQFAALQFLVALGIASFIHENGPRFIHGNFGWQTIICSALLYWVTGVRVVQELPHTPGRRWLLHTVAVLGLLHVVSGGFYLARAITAHTFM